MNGMNILTKINKSLDLASHLNKVLTALSSLKVINLDKYN